MILAQGLGWRYASGARALAGVTLEIGPGGYLALAGRSGSGKSTLLRCLNGLIPHFFEGSMEGRVTVWGRDTGEHPVRELYEDVGLVFQNPDAQLFTASAEREIAFGLESLGWEAGAIRRRVAEVADEMGIPHLLGRAPASLSAGEKQLVALASVLAPRVRSVLLDEPFAHLDPVHVRELRRQLVRLPGRGTSVTVAGHQLSHVLPEAEVVALLEDGRLAALGPPAEALASPPPWLLLPAWHPHAGLEAAMEAGHAPPAAAPPPAAGEEVLLRVEEVDFAYPGSGAALRGVSLELRRGECLAVVGGNGSGKTTLLKQLNGLLRPARGRVLVGGREARRQRVAQLAGQVGLVLQNPNDQFFRPTVEEEIRYGARLLGRLDEAWIEALVERFELGPLLRRHPHALSHGQKRRLALAAMLALRPAVLALDEPTTGQDRLGRQALAGLLRGLLEEGLGLVVATHDLEFAEGLAHRWLALADGRPVALGRPEEVMGDGRAMARARLVPTDGYLLRRRFRHRPIREGRR